MHYIGKVATHHHHHHSPLSINKSRMRSSRCLQRASEPYYFHGSGGADTGFCNPPSGHSLLNSNCHNRTQAAQILFRLFRGATGEVLKLHFGLNKRDICSRWISHTFEDYETDKDIPSIPHAHIDWTYNPETITNSNNSPYILSCTTLQFLLKCLELDSNSFN